MKVGDKVIMSRSLKRDYCKHSVNYDGESGAERHLLAYKDSVGVVQRISFDGHVYHAWVKWPEPDTFFGDTAFGYPITGLTVVP